MNMTTIEKASYFKTAQKYIYVSNCFENLYKTLYSDLEHPILNIKYLPSYLGQFE